MNRTLRATTLRAGGPQDLPAIAALMSASFDPRFGEAWTAGQCMGMLALPGAWLIMAERDGDPVGFALSRTVADEGELLLIAVHPDMRGSGVGRALLRAAMFEARARGVLQYHLEVRRGNSALELYVSEGFSKIGERPDYYRGPAGQTYDALTYRKAFEKNDGSI